jgi:hypothetical protein
VEQTKNWARNTGKTPGRERRRSRDVVEGATHSVVELVKAEGEHAICIGDAANLSEMRHDGGGAAVVWRRSRTKDCVCACVRVMMEQKRWENLRSSATSNEDWKAQRRSTSST